jgi:hypothetical protein
VTDTQSIEDMIRQREALNAAIFAAQEAAEINRPVVVNGPGLYRTRGGTVARVYEIGVARIRGKRVDVALGVVVSGDGISDASSWAFNGLFMLYSPGTESTLDLIERIGDLP